MLRFRSRFPLGHFFDDTARAAADRAHAQPGRNRLDRDGVRAGHPPLGPGLQLGVPGLVVLSEIALVAAVIGSLILPVDVRVVLDDPSAAHT